MDFGIQIREIKPQKIAAVRAKTTINKVTPKVVQLLQETAEYLESVGVQPAGPASASTTRWARSSWTWR